ncbi:helix-turn-helix transcriptional regulator [Paroceanicella profunda]|uniref:Helix-turn-helix transcriptional regulator n=1 Tax=Paroceanicella profunda TaxID=2579971 RepID=A0A5B8FI81_9RHOB|nr:XRE family transcriptional regulator [Paroceanicella profunda]QDL92937.1 helix-turn-helix transcriptional regulator [Paroceanicella profunda]
MADPRENSLLQLARAGQPQAAVAELRLGERVRELRRERNWTLEQAAKQAGLARSTLSKIENEQMSPTFDAVQKLARGLGISVPQLFTPSRSDRVLARRALTPAGQGKPHPTPTYEHRMLAPEIAAKKMLPYLATIRARSFEEFDGWVRHDGEEFLFVVSGRIRFYCEYYEAVEMGPGDSAYYDASMGHNLVSVSAQDAEVLWVTTLDPQ